MRRNLLPYVGALFLAAMPVAPFFHLAVVPHRYCLEHQAFEGAEAPAPPGHQHDEPKRPGAPEDPHETCLIAGLALQSLDHDPEFVIVAQQSCAQEDWIVPLERQTPLRPLDTVSLAPKTSPPA